MVLAALLHRQKGFCAVDGLNLAHPVNREDDGKIRWIDVQVDSVLMNEGRIVESLAHRRRPERPAMSRTIRTR